MQGGFQHFHYIIGSDLTLFASNHTGTRLIHHRKPSGHQLPAALSLFARCWLNLAILLSVLKAFTAILYCTEIQYLLKCGRRSILFATATASMRAQPAPYFSTLDLNSSVRDSGALDEVWLRTRMYVASFGNLSKEEFQRLLGAPADVVAAHLLAQLKPGQTIRVLRDRRGDRSGTY